MNGQISPSLIEQRIFLIRGQKIIIDRDLAQLYKVPTFVLNQSVRRNLTRFPDGFMFRLSREEAQELITNCDRLNALKHSAIAPLAFTEYGVAMLSSVLRSRRAVQVNIQIIQTYIRMRQWALTHKELAGKIAELEGKIENQGKEIQTILRALRNLVNPAESARKSIGFRANT